MDRFELAMATDYYILSLHLYVSALCWFVFPMRRLQHSIDEFVFLFFFYPFRSSFERTTPFSSTTMNTHRVAIVGAGAAGVSAAYALSKHPDKFTVTVFEKEPVAGGMASSMDVDSVQCGASYINDGVQGCSPAFANTLRVFHELGYPPEKVDMQCASHTSPHVCFLSHYISSFSPPFASTESVSVKAKTFGPMSFPPHSQSASPPTSGNSVVS